MPKRTFEQLKLDQIESTLQSWRRLPQAAAPKEGWVRTLRKALGMSSEQLARRMKATPQLVRKLEKGESAGTLNLASLRRAADALDCDVVYALVPRRPLREMLRERAQAVAKEQVRRVSHSMDLEAQGVDQRAEEQQLEQLVENLLRESPRKLWR